MLELCGYRKVDLKLSTRVFRCVHCSYEIDRDLNAATNVRNKGIEKVGWGTPEVTPVEIGVQPSSGKAQLASEAGSHVR